MTTTHFSGLSDKEAWSIRRKVIYITLLLAAAAIVYILGFVPTPKPIHGDYLNYALTLCATVVNLWVFGSVAEDVKTERESDKHFSGLDIKAAWELRRRVIFNCLGFSLFCLLYLLVPSDSTSDSLDLLHREAVSSIFMFAGSLLLGWMFGSSAQKIWRPKNASGH